MREDWHPFKDTPVRGDYWFREGQSDNCLHTSVSIGLDFKTATTFPLIEHKLAAFASGLPHSTTVPTGGVVFHKALVADLGMTEWKVRYVDRQQLYMVILDSTCFNTQTKQQEKFPEVAVKRVPAEKIVGTIAFIRVFHRTEDKDGFVALFSRAGSIAPTQERTVAITGDEELGILLFRRLTAMYNETIASMPFSVKWTASGASAVPSTVRIQKVKTMDDQVFWPS